MTERSSGILMHISSLPGKYGIGDFGRGAYDFVDFLVTSHQKYWQILPLGITSFGDSPYQSFSAFAGNPYFIDLDEMVGKDYIKEEDLKENNLYIDKRKVDYALLYKNKMKLLRIAYNNSKEHLQSELKKFKKGEEYWLRDFSLFMALKHKYENKSWHDWEPQYKTYDSKEVLDFEKNNLEEIDFWVFTQYFFYKQWDKLKKYANTNGIKIIGDLAIYMSEDSADLWSNPKYFKLDKDLVPISVAGVPPDSFSENGQLWGNPIYDWKALEEDGYKWWIMRIAHSFKLYDTLRIDHFRGFESYWEVKYGAKTAIEGRWVKGPGLHLFDKIKEELGQLDIILEDLGYITPEVIKMVEDSGFPNMKVLQFAFNPYEDSEHAPHSYDKNCVAYTSTHDNQTLMAWFEDLPSDISQYTASYLKLNYDEGLNWAMIRGAWASAANLAMTSIQDMLGLDDMARMNTPSSIDNNWTWRVLEEQLTDELALKIKSLTRLYWR